MTNRILFAVSLVGLAACGNMTEKGKKNETKGDVEHTVGSVVGDSSLKANGTQDKDKGKVQKAVGTVKDAVTNP